MKIVIISLLLISSFAPWAKAQQQTWGVRIAQTVMKIHPDSIVVKKYVTHGDQKMEEKAPTHPSTWDYEQGVVLKGFDELWKQTKDEQYFNYMKKIIDRFVQADGSIRTYEFTEYNIDNITPGRIVLSLYQKTKEEKYKKAADLIREQLNWQPRTKEGGFWHKHRYPYQMWLDGLYMGEPFYAEYSKIFNQPKSNDDIVNQFVWVEKHTRDAKTGLLYHAWDESKKQRWSNPKTGQSPEFWSRAMGWYAIALVDVLDYIPLNHPRRKELISSLQRLSVAIKNFQDANSGVWFQITDKASVPGNYLEASASCMFVYALAKGVRLGYLDKTFLSTANKGFDGIIKNFIELDDAGMPHLTKTCSGAGLGGNPYRDGSFEYYIKEPLRRDDLKAIGPFIQASIELGR
ncbi:MAG TPA: glycoside hydrolase family 88 protein [Cyclobacteriaceae bacterium]